jgi:two-component system, OmpR family, sensor kinase
VRFLPRTLYGRLSGFILVLIILINIFYVALALEMTRVHVQEIDQTLNRNLAANLVREGWLTFDIAVNKDLFRQVIDKIGAINPRIEIYTLDLSGTILNCSGPMETLERTSVSLTPIAAFLAQSQAPPIFGDDPRDATRRKIFSVAPISNGHRLAGYIYVVLGGKNYDSVMSMLQNSYVIRLGLWTMAGGFGVVVTAGLAAFHFLTRRLRRLSAQVDAYRRNDDPQANASARSDTSSSGDEIDQIAETFANMSQRIDHQLRQLKLADDSRRTFLASVSHDLRTPLSALQGYIETILMKMDTLSDEQKTKYLSLALNNGEKLRHLIDDLFKFSTLDTGDWPLRREAFSLSDLVQDVCQKFELRARETGIHLTLNILDGATLVDGDLGLIERLLDNLIDNGIKFTGPGGSVRIMLIPAHDGLVVEISDTGIGISEKHLPHIFEPFYSVEPRVGDARGGAGLGLAIASRIAELHHSKIEVESTPGVGTLFRFVMAAVVNRPATITNS